MATPRIERCASIWSCTSVDLIPGSTPGMLEKHASLRGDFERLRQCAGSRTPAGPRIYFACVPPFSTPCSPPRAPFRASGRRTPSCSTNCSIGRTARGCSTYCSTCRSPRSTGARAQKSAMPVATPSRRWRCASPSTGRRPATARVRSRFWSRTTPATSNSSSSSPMSNGSRSGCRSARRVGSRASSRCGTAICRWCIPTASWTNSSSGRCRRSSRSMA